MISPFKKAKNISLHLDSFFDVTERSTILFESGIKNYLKKDFESLNHDLSEIRIEERTADSLLKDIEETLYKYSLMPELRSDIMRMVQSTDDLIDIMKEVLSQFDVERPNIPEELHERIIELANLSSKAALEANKGARIFFRDTEQTKKHIEKALRYESQADQLAEQIKRRAFHDLDDLSLPEKFHIRYFTLHIENLSDIAQKLAYILNLLVIKRFS